MSDEPRQMWGMASALPPAFRPASRGENQSAFPRDFGLICSGRRRAEARRQGGSHAPQAGIGFAR
jgi:hypothetical protein